MNKNIVIISNFHYSNFEPFEKIALVSIIKLFKKNNFVVYFLFLIDEIKILFETIDNNFIKEPISFLNSDVFAYSTIIYYNFFQEIVFFNKNIIHIITNNDEIKYKFVEENNYNKTINPNFLKLHIQGVNDDCVMKMLGYKTLNCALYLDSEIPHQVSQSRSGVCYYLPEKNITYFYEKILHFYDSYKINDKELNYSEIIEVFNKHEYFICYDYTLFLIPLALYCGCLPILIPLENISKETIIKQSFIKEYANKNNLCNLSGVCYGYDDIRHGFSTLSHSRNEWNEILNFYNKNYHEHFIKTLIN